MDEQPSQEGGSFYERIATFYDTMTGFTDRVRRDEPIFLSLITDYGIRTALDVGAGTGLHSILLAKLGVAVTAVDISPAMVDALHRNARMFNVSITALTMRMDSLLPQMTGSFDGLFCLGNTIPHLQTHEMLRRSLSEFLRVLRPGGTLVLQLLNFDMLDAGSALPTFSRTEGGVTFERAYERTATGVRLTVTIRRQGSAEPQSASINLKAFSSRILMTALARTGFRHAALYGDLARRRFDPAISKDVVIVAHKSRRSSE